MNLNSLKTIRTIRKKTFFIGGFILLALVLLPVTLFFFQEQQVTQSNAEKTVDLTFDPSSSQASPLQIPAGSTFTLDVYLDPGTNAVSYLKLDLQYDPTKFEPAGSFTPNLDAFTQVQGPVDATGKETIVLSVGSDASKAIKTKTKVGTLALKALETVPANTTSVVSFGTDSQALSVSGNSSYGENVIASTTPVTIQINKPVTSCGNTPSDSMLLMDSSDSMNDNAGSLGSKLTYAKAAAKHYVTVISGQPTNRVGLTTFDNMGYLKSGFTNAFATVKTLISGITTKAGTCMQCGILKANAEITAHKRAGIKNIVILLTDGRANMIEGHTGYVSTTTAEADALAAAKAGHNTNGTVFYTIGLGKDVLSSFLRQLATSTGGKYFFTPTADQLDSIYTQISEIIQGGQVSGIVFNDANGNGSYDPSETPMHGVLLKLFQSNSSTPTQLISTSSDGTYTLQHVSNIIYTNIWPFQGSNFTIKNIW